ncbi:hypothetical protein ROZALSC1DRAFT_25903 [Rozella allomycis CSF55]|uniref:Uncharacterized protein n=1 Tax=Rozella allomycis (strain CSF55) TaxID=988480 RepID=A0A4P9YA08_ROZAC|nr:hypothetical protein ROZALSC1DRAFT_25903 [Rozella allomycis CSF55]
MIKDDLSSSKSDPYYTGPFNIVRRNKGGAYILLGPDGTLYTRPPHAVKPFKEITPKIDTSAHKMTPITSGFKKKTSIKTDRFKDTGTGKDDEINIRSSAFKSRDQ